MGLLDWLKGAGPAFPVDGHAVPAALPTSVFPPVPIAPAQEQPMSSIRDDLIALLRREEGEKLRVYDDATGKAIAPGTLVQGHPTIGVGRALDTNGISAAESAYLLGQDVDGLLAKMPGAIAGWAGLAPARQVVLTAMAFQMGLPGLLAFKGTLASVAAGDYAAAATGMLASKWATQTPARANRMAAAMRTGVLAA